MARIRSIKPGFFKNEDLAELSPWHRLCFAGLWTEADKAGRLEDRPRRLKADLFPYDDDVDMDGLLADLAAGGFIVRYVVEEVAYIAVINFEKHQRPRDDEPESQRPEPSAGTVTSPTRRSDDRVSAQSIGKERNLGSGNRSTDHALARFERFWSVYSRKVGKDAAWREWQKLKPGDDLTDVMIAAVERHKASPQWQRDGGQFIPHPRTWLHQGRWKDAPEGFAAPVATTPRELWFDECRRLHGSSCADRNTHRLAMLKEPVSA